jgi:heme A synthase
MTRPFRVLAWVAAVATYLLIVFGAIVRITGSGMGCGDHWPLCNGHLFPPLDDPTTVIEWMHRLIAAVISVPIAVTAFLAWRLRRAGGPDAPGTAAYWALGLLIPQALLGAITVKLELPAWTVIIHFMTASIMLAALLVAAINRPLFSGERAARGALIIGFFVVLLGAFTANTGAAGACTGFPLCNGQIWPTSGGLAHMHWVHRLLAYALTLHVIGWVMRSRRAARTAHHAPRMGPWVVLGLILLQIMVGAGLVTAGFPPAMQAVHVAVGMVLWAGLVIVNAASRGVNEPRQQPSQGGVRG